MRTLIPLSRLWKLSLVFFAAITVISCQKEINPLEEDGTLPGEEVVVPASDSYMPYTKGSTWKYTDSVTGFIFVLQASDDHKTVNGISYNKYEVIEGTSEGDLWYGKLKNDYYLLMEAGSLSGISADINMLFLNDKEAAGFTWTKDAGSANGFPARIKGQIIEKGITKTIEGKTFKDIIHTTVSLEYNMLGQWMSVGIYTFYCAKGIGLVKLDSGLDALGQVRLLQSSRLIEYSIK
ncbi:hypothetical protein [Flavihumibacter sp. UBA7668]|uniref:hypothetical protein n=1 Tax=Flavihumibacter sp. UBA7668 TaxID=1946542 RepID=UPI0025BC985F|nr:hypothetical protein [Flavihumibacter sp. UBA7668]